MDAFAARLSPGRPLSEAPWRALTLAAILLLHAAALFALRGSLRQPAAPAAPVHEVVATFVAPEAAPTLTPAPVPKAEPHPQPAKPHTPPPVKKKPSPEPKPVAREPAPQAASTPPAPADPAPAAAPTPPAVAAAPAAPAAPAVPAAPAIPKTITSGVRYLQPPRPDYPPLSRRLGEQGKAVLRVLIDAQGRAERVELQQSAGFPRLDEAAKQAVLRAVFQPYLENGRPVAVFAIIPISFQLD